MGESYDASDEVRGEKDALPLGRATALSPPELMRLDLWAQAFVWAFKHQPYLVGSVLTRRDYRDVDVRLPVDDDDVMFEDPDRLRLVHVAMSVWAQQVSGLPVDFQFQPWSEWTAEVEQGKPRNPLGDRWRTVHGGARG